LNAPASCPSSSSRGGTPRSFEPRQRDARRAPRHVAHGTQADGRQPPAARRGQQQRHRNRHQHRFTNFVLFACDVGQWTRDYQRCGDIAELFRPDANAPRAIRSANGARPGLTARRQKIRRRQPIESHRQRSAVAIQDGDSVAERRNRGTRFRRRRHRIVELPQFLAKQVRQRLVDGLELAIRAPHAEALLDDDHINAEEQQHDDERHDVPQRQPRTQRMDRHGRSALN
jgi:hypothetical protein